MPTQRQSRTQQPAARSPRHAAAVCPGGVQAPEPPSRRYAEQSAAPAGTAWSRSALPARGGAAGRAPGLKLAAVLLAASGLLGPDPALLRASSTLSWSPKAYDCDNGALQCPDKYLLDERPAGTMAMSGSVSVTFEEDSDSHTVLLRSKACPGSVTDTWNDFGTIRAQVCRLPTPHVTSYIYDADGNLQSIAYPRGLSVDYLYAGADPDRVTAVTADEGSGPFDIASGIAYLPFGDVAGLTWGDEPGSHAGRAN